MQEAVHKGQCMQPEIFFLIEKSVHWWSAAAQALNAPDRVGK